MQYNALASQDRVEHLFPEAHPLRKLVRPTFDTIRRGLAGVVVSAIWVDSAYDPSREGYRPSYDKLYGKGASTVMPFVGTWLSTGPGTEREGNVVLFPEGMDPTIARYAQDIGLLGAHAWVRSFEHLKATVRESGRKVYSIDDLGDDFDAHVVIGSRLSRWLNSKDDLASITAHAPPEVVKDMYDASLADFRAARRDGARVFLKTCNTESAGAGVYIASDERSFEEQLGVIRAKQRQYGLNRTLVIQPEIKGRNCSFQVFLDPRRRDEIQVVALTDQLVEADGKTYKASINHPITAANLERVGPAIVDMVERVWARHPEAFGFLMSDYFQTDDGVVIYDPGIRPTGNTATALAFHLARKLTGRDLFASLVQLPTNTPGLTFERFAKRAGPLVDPENLRREGRAILPWGWNPVQGYGMVICVAEDEAAWTRLRDEVRAFRYA